MYPCDHKCEDEKDSIHILSLYIFDMCLDDHLMKNYYVLEFEKEIGYDFNSQSTLQKKFQGESFSVFLLSFFSLQVSLSNESTRLLYFFPRRNNSYNG
jgi:hypothetical protein